MDSASDLVANISIPIGEFAPRRILCLVASLKERYRERTNILVNIFSSAEAASRSVFPQEYTAHDLALFSQMHARYVLDAAKHQEYIELRPAGARPTGGGPYSSRIELPVGAAPQCHLEIDGRCILALDDLDYPDEAIKLGVSGAVTLVGSLTRGGTIRKIRPLTGNTARLGVDALLVKAATENLSSWRTEPGQDVHSVQITYSYRIDRSLPNTERLRVQWSLPNQITISGKPPE